MSKHNRAGADLQADVFIGPFLPFEQGGGTFAATTSTLVSGPSEAVLIDAQHIRTDVAALAEELVRYRVHDGQMSDGLSTGVRVRLGSAVAANERLTELGWTT